MHRTWARAPKCHASHLGCNGLGVAVPVVLHMGQHTVSPHRSCVNPGYADSRLSEGPDGAGLKPSCNACHRHEKIDFWEDVYGFNMSAIRALAMGEPLVDCVDQEPGGHAPRPARHLQPGLHDQGRRRVLCARLTPPPHTHPCHDLLINLFSFPSLSHLSCCTCKTAHSGALPPSMRGGGLGRGWHALDPRLES